jgi:hypothetical protein
MLVLSEPFAGGCASTDTYAMALSAAATLALATGALGSGPRQRRATPALGAILKSGDLLFASAREAPK